MTDSFHVGALRCVAVRVVEVGRLALVVLVASSVPAHAPAAGTAETLRGLIVEQIPAGGMSEPELNALDTNGDGVLDVADVISVGEVRVGFETGMSQWLEGSETPSVPLAMSAPFFGEVGYTISGAAMDQGAVQAAGGEVVSIPLPRDDDAEVEAARVYQIAIDGSRGSYGLGRISLHSAIVEDDDSVWLGSFESNGLAVHFELQLMQEGGVLSGVLVTDGFGIIPRAEGTEVGETSEWPLTELSLSAEGFYAKVSGLPIPEGTTQIGGLMFRELVLEASLDEAAHSIEPDAAIIGSVTERITAPDRPYLDREITGRFTLRKAVPEIGGEAPTLVDAAD